MSRENRQIIDTALNVLTNESRLLTGEQARPIKLKNYINTLAAAFRRPSTRLSLPTSISGLWKADLFMGYTDIDKWVGTSVKINPSALEGARGLRIGLVPTQSGVDRRDFLILEVIEALKPLSQPELLETDEKNTSTILTRDDKAETNTVIAPIPKKS